jgi:hypothetical protein
LWLGSDFRAATEADDSMRDFFAFGKGRRSAALKSIIVPIQLAAFTHQSTVSYLLA